MKKHLLVAGMLAAAFYASPSFAQTKLVEKVTKSQGELVIPYEKYVLPNGLTLIVHEDHSDPIVHVDVTYHVGSAREEIGKSGFAHFFEHMMFQGSDNVADEEHFKIVSDAGGTLNGTTNRDRTNYFETLPSNQLEIALWLEADRMGFLLDAVTQQKFEVQRSTVKNERGQNYDNRPYGLMREVGARNLYPYGHPYSWLTIGYLEDLNRVDVNDLKRFFLRWYGPNNATVTVGGDVDPKQVLALVEKYFGSIPQGPAVQEMAPMVPVLEKDRYASYIDNYIRFPQVTMTFPVAESHHPDEIALDCLADLLAGGKNSVFYKNFEKSQKAIRQFAYNSTSELAGEFTIMIMPMPGQNLSSIDSLIRASLLEFEQKGFSDADVERFKTQMEAGLISRFESVSGKVSALAAYQTFLGNPNFSQEELKRLRALKKEDVLRVYNKYIKGKPALITTALPKTGDVQPPAPDNHTIDSTQYKAPADQYAGLTYNKAKDSFDRSKRPAPGANPVVQVPNYWKAKMKNGIEAIGTKTDEIPTVTLILSFKGGSFLDPQGKAGTAYLMSQLMSEGTENYTPEAFEDALKGLGASISVGAGNDEVYVYVQALAKNIDPTLALLEERLFRSKFTQEDLDRIRQNTIKLLGNRSTQAASVASDIYSKLVYGKDDIRAIPSFGTEASLPNITLADIEEFRKNSLSASKAQLVVVGAIEQKAIMKKLKFLGKIEAKPVAIPTFVTPKSPEKTKIYFVNQPKAAQSEIRIGHIALPADIEGEFYKATLMNYNLGGAFNSRINLNLREDKGYTYGARSGFSGGKDYAGTFTASAGVKAVATDSSIVEFMKEINKYIVEGTSAEEVQFMKNSIGQRDARQYETGFQKARFLGQIIDYSLDKEFVKRQQQILQALDKAQIDALAKKYIRPNNAYIVVVGDRDTVMPGLSQLGYEIVELDKEGNEIKQ